MRKTVAQSVWPQVKKHLEVQSQGLAVSNSWAPFLEKLTAGILILCPRLGGRDIKWYLSWKDKWYSHETESYIPQLTESVSFCFPECSVHCAGQQAIIMASWDAKLLDAGWYAVLHSTDLGYPQSSLDKGQFLCPGSALKISGRTLWPGVTSRAEYWPGLWRGYHSIIEERAAPRLFLLLF